MEVERTVLRSIGGDVSNCSRTLGGPRIAARRPAAPLTLLDN